MSNETVIHFDGEDWKNIPGYSDMYVTRTGRVASKRRGTMIERIYQKSNRLYGIDEHGNESRYILVTLPGKRGGRSRTSTGVHRLVCLTWNGPPPSDGKRYEVNHIDGNKANNNAKNLEWVTGAKNVQHCFNIGKHSTANRIIATNVETGEVKYYRSAAQLAFEYGFNHIHTASFINKYETEPLNGWVFEYEIKDSSKSYQHYASRQVAYKDYLTNVITLSPSCRAASNHSKVKCGTIVSAIRHNRLKGLRLTGQFVFQDLTMDMVWPEYTDEEVKASMESMHKRSLLTASRQRF